MSHEDLSRKPFGIKILFLQFTVKTVNSAVKLVARKRSGNFGKKLKKIVEIQLV